MIQTTSKTIRDMDSNPSANCTATMSNDTEVLCDKYQDQKLMRSQNPDCQDMVLPHLTKPTSRSDVIIGRIIICIASNWDYNPTSKHHVMKALSQTNDVVWINYRGTRRPKLNKLDIKSGLATLQRVTKGIQRINANMVQLTPFVLPGVRSRFLDAIHQRLLIAQIRRALSHVPGYGNKPIQVWTFAPDVGFLQGVFNEEAFVYYCVDEYSQFEGFDGPLIKARERNLLRRSDVVIASSQELARNRRTQRCDIHLVRHGVDYDHFAQAFRHPLHVPDDLRKCTSQPIFGFFGMIHHWVDIDLIAEVARLRPQYHFAMLGEQKVDVGSLKRRPNVHLLGEKPYTVLPAYCRGFVAGLLPFVRNEMTKNINPIKLREYLAAGLSVISTPLPEAQRYAGVVKICDTPETFARACDAVLHENKTSTREQISQTVVRESWQSVVQQLAHIVNEHIMKGK